MSYQNGGGSSGGGYQPVESSIGSGELPAVRIDFVQDSF